MQAHIMRCAAGLPVPYHERVFLLVHALTQPFDPSSLRPASLPSGLTFVEEDNSYWLDDLEMLWIPPIPHWLGDELHRAPIENPIRSVTPSTGFFIAQNLASEDAPRLLSWSDAQQWCAEVARHYGVPIRLPTADEWEMAARGSDGRRFPWGNAFDPEFESALSPWGGAQMVGVAPQWVSASDGSPQVCGGIKQWRCSVRIPADDTTTGAVRFVIAT
ncbi:MAG: SUMF1/EgtB/PvdO family nonheme iron enzyme [Anaerolineae bacterium]|nr:SUMF1/EgtB/PvdO family nonheme iron enzyme [Anaerolineae bacterium]